MTKTLRTLLVDLGPHSDGELYLEVMTRWRGSGLSAEQFAKGEGARTNSFSVVEPAQP